jgi:hypothetical protein
MQIAIPELSGATVRMFDLKGYIYFNINQLPYQSGWNDGVDGTQQPGLILRSKLPDGAHKNLILGPSA